MSSLQRDNPWKTSNCPICNLDIVFDDEDNGDAWSRCYTCGRVVHSRCALDCDECIRITCKKCLRIDRLAKALEEPYKFCPSCYDNLEPPYSKYVDPEDVRENPAYGPYRSTKEPCKNCKIPTWQECENCFYPSCSSCSVICNERVHVLCLKCAYPDRLSKELGNITCNRCEYGYRENPMIYRKNEQETITKGGFNHLIDVLSKLSIKGEADDLSSDKTTNQTIYASVVVDARSDHHYTAAIGMSAKKQAAEAIAEHYMLTIILDIPFRSTEYNDRRNDLVFLGPYKINKKQAITIKNWPE